MKNNWRIYLTGRGLGGHRPFLNWVKNNIELKSDRNGCKFIFVSDLVPYIGKPVGTNIHNSAPLDITDWFDDKIVAFGEVDKFIESIKEELGEVRYNAYKRSGASQLWIHEFKKKDIEEKRRLLSKVGLEDWA